MREISRLSPKDPRAWEGLGAALTRGGLLTEAEDALKRALEIRPGSESTLLPLAVLQEELERGEAADTFRKLAKITDDLSQRRMFSAKALVIEGCFEEAETEIRRALAMGGSANPRTHLALGKVLNRLGKFAEAERAVTPILDDLPVAFEIVAEGRRMNKADLPLVERMRTHCRAMGDRRARTTLCFALGKSYDDLGDYAEAMSLYDEGNRLKAASMRFDRQGLASNYDDLIARFSAEEFARLGQARAASASPDDGRPIFIVGMPRSGTTLVEQILSSHPLVGSGGELAFWRTRVRQWRASGVGVDALDAIAKAAEDYRAVLRGIDPGARHVIDKSPFNLEFLPILLLAFPNARIIHCLRHPVDTCLSNYFSNFDSAQTFASDRGDLVFVYRQCERLMEHWRRVIPADRIAEIHYEKLVADRESETRRLVAFCALPWDDACLAHETNARPVSTASVWQVRQPIYVSSLERWWRYEPWLGEFRELLPDSDAAQAR